jgi:mannose-1-phosphate guanylyltransferase
LPLAGSTPLIVQTVERILPLVSHDRIRILTGDALRPAMLRAVPELGAQGLLIEPRARGTAPVLAWAAHTIVREQPDAVMVSLHADHRIEPDAAFRATIAATARLASAEQRLFTIGAQPSRAETGYGYIRTGEPIAGDVDAFVVDRFVEKPDRATAERYVAEGYLWNTGLFVWPARLLLEQLQLHSPELGPLLALLDEGRVDEFFARAPDLSIDTGLLERSDRVGVVRASFDWDDVGAWDALGRTRPGDDRGNVAVGPAHFIDADDCIAWSENGDIVLFGTRDLVVVRAHGVTFVAPRDRVSSLKEALAALPDRLVRLEDGA